MTIQVQSDFPIEEKTFHPKFRLFEVDGPGEDNVCIYHHFYQRKEISKKSDPIYKNKNWEIYREKDLWIYQYHPANEKSGFPTVGFFNKDHTRNHIYSDQITEKIYGNYGFLTLSLLESDQMLFAKLLADRNGIILHSNGFNIRGKGLLLAGRSGVGKSTVSKMLKKSGHQILCDDRMFIMRKKDGFGIYGNWCHGSVMDFSSFSVPLKAIFFLGQSNKNIVEPVINKHVIMQKLIQSLVRSVMTMEGWEKILSIVWQLADNVPCFHLKFDLTGEVCEKIDDTMSAL